MKFDQAVKNVIRIEGEDKITEDPNDPGGVTKYGISQRAFPNVNVRDLTREEAIYLYHTHYWEPVKASQLPASLRYHVFDCGVNQGVPVAIKMLQTVLGVKTDGVIGPVTLAAAQKADEKELLFKFVKARLTRYRSTKNYDKYGFGWTVRVLDVTVDSASFLGAKA